VTSQERALCSRPGRVPWKGPRCSHCSMDFISQKGGGQVASERRRGWLAGIGLNGEKNLHCPLSEAAGPGQKPNGDAICIQVFQSDSWGGGAGKFTPGLCPSPSPWVSLSHTQMLLLCTFPPPVPMPPACARMRPHIPIRARGPCPSAAVRHTVLAPCARLLSPL
jgi:hypothetical protein